ncbi:MAG: TraR/DksA C4-type zinc finger protein [Patescibacteria group bacterium]|nr:TraR/DksA C4-type zinc finger protein [Patescibacteria group bacterium]
MIKINKIVPNTIRFPKAVLGSIKSYLEQKQKDTEVRLKSLKEEDPFADPDRLTDIAASDSEAKAEFGHFTVTAAQTELNKTLIRVRKALTKIKIGKYGICDKCGKMIDTDRLAAMPTADLCVSCERKNEK